jgi:oligopeptide transport system permease protein
MYFYDPYTMYLEHSLEFFSDYTIKNKHILGLDELGRDMLSRSVLGIFISMFIGIISSILIAIIAIIYSLLASISNRYISNLMITFLKILISIPSLLYVMVVSTILNSSIVSVIISISITRWFALAMILITEIEIVKNRDYITASKLLGSNKRDLFIRHILPNITDVLWITLLFNIPKAIFYESFLSFIGFGVPLPNISIGRMISNGVSYRVLAPHMFFVPVAFMLTFVSTLNYINSRLKRRKYVNRF